MTPRLKELFFKEIQPALKNQFGLKNIYMTPKIEKIVLNMGLGLDGNDAKILKSCEEDMAKITGQKPVITKFKKSVANFKTRKGTNAGLKVTLRKNKMYEFLDRLVNIALPRIKDFRGLSANGFDKFGNYTFGVKEHIIFPEVSFDRADKVRGLDIVVVIKAINKDHAFALLEKMRQLNMAKVSAVNKNEKRIKLSDRLYKKRQSLKKIIMDKKLPLEERFKAQQKLSQMPRNSAKTRVMNRCQITGRPHGVYRKLKISRIALRDLGLAGLIPGMTKSSW